MTWTDLAACRGSTAWTSLQPRRHHLDLIEACQHCPVIDACRDHAARFRWADVVVGGWRAPAVNPARPPWARPRPARH